MNLSDIARDEAILLLMARGRSREEALQLLERFGLITAPTAKEEEK